MRSASGQWRLLVLFLIALILLGSSSAVRTADYFFLDSFEPDSQCVDLDLDGWTICRGDCCETPGQCGPDATLVNPGAFDFLGDAIDNDCDGVTDNVATICDGALVSNSSQPLDYARAMDLCSATTENPPIQQRTWGVISGAFLLANGTGTPAANSRSIRSGFGSNVFPLGGNQLAVLSTGRAADTNDTNPNFASFQGGQSMGTSSGVPSDWLAANGGNPPATPGCPSVDLVTAVDPILLKLRIRVPTNAKSFSTKAFLYSSEYPEFTCSPYSDYFLMLLDSQFVPGVGEAANPADKNIAFYDPPPAGAPFYPISGNLAFGNTGLFTQCQNGPTGCASTAVAGSINTCTGTSQLVGTGFDIANPPPQFPSDPGYCGVNNLLGGGTSWLTVSGNVVRGETIELRFVAWDTSDAWYDTVVLFDDFRWSTTPTTPGTTP